MYNTSMFLRQHTPILIAVGIAVFFIATAFIAPQFAIAQDTGGLVPCNGPECNFCHLAQLGQNIINLTIFLAVFLSAALFAWAGWNYLTNFGDTSKVSKAHGIFVNVAVGFIIVLAAWLIVDTLMKVMLGGSFGPWNEVCGVNSNLVRTNAGVGAQGGVNIDFTDVFSR